MKKEKSNAYTLPADGEWQTILTELDGLSAFKIIGYAQGSKSTGKYCVIHSIALNAYSGKKGRIHSKCDYYGWQWWKRLKLRWIGNPFNYQLQIKTCSNYGEGGRIEVAVKKLLKDEFKPILRTLVMYPITKYSDGWNGLVKPFDRLRVQSMNHFKGPGTKGYYGEWYSTF